MQIVRTLSGDDHPLVVRIEIKGARYGAGHKLPDARELAGLCVHRKTGDGVVAAIGGVNESAIAGDLDVGAGVLAAIEIRRQRAL